MSKKILVYYHSIGKTPDPNDMVYKLPYEFKIIESITEDKRVPMMHTLMNIPVNRYMFAHIKDLNILSIMYDFNKYLYDGVMFLDMNKVCSSVDEFVDIVEDALERNSILSTKFVSDSDINDLKIRRSSTNRMPNGVLMIPSSRIDEFLNFRIECITQTRDKILEWFNTNKKISPTGNFIHRKWKYMDYGNDNNVSAYSELFKNIGLDYGCVEENCSIGTTLQRNKLKNVTVMKFSTHPIKYDGNLYLFTGNRLVSSGSFNIKTYCAPYPRELSEERPKRPKTIKRSHSSEDYDKARENLNKLLEEEVNEEISYCSIIP